MHKGSNSSICWPTRIISCYFNNSHPDGYKVLMGGFDLLSLMISNGEHLFNAIYNMFRFVKPQSKSHHYNYKTEPFEHHGAPLCYPPTATLSPISNPWQPLICSPSSYFCSFKNAVLTDYLTF